jgi:hypothetical protein
MCDPRKSVQFKGSSSMRPAGRASSEGDMGAGTEMSGRVKESLVNEWDGMEDSGFKLCPYCKQRIRATAIKCRFCAEWLEEPPRASATLQRDEAGVGRAVPGASVTKDAVEEAVGSAPLAEPVPTTLPRALPTTPPAPPNTVRQETGVTPPISEKPKPPVMGYVARH